MRRKKNITTWKSTSPQGQYWKVWFSSKDWALAFVAGFGSGKSEILHIIAIATVILFPWANIAIYSPTYDLLKLNNIPRISQLLTAAGLEWTFNKSDYIFYVKGHGNIICRSMDNPARIIAYEVFASFVDELDTMSTIKADEAWNKIISRNRQQPEYGTIIPSGVNYLAGVKPKPEESDIRPMEATTCPVVFDNDEMELVNKCGVFTTPEGYKFTYRKWHKEDNAGYYEIKASTYSNQHLPRSYIETMKATYPPQLIEAYLKGEYVNLNGNAVYHEFDRVTNHFHLNFENFEEEILKFAA